MKKIFLFSMVMAAALSSCTKENVIDSSNESANNSLNPNAPVEIKLGASNEASATVTRAAIDAWSNTKIGIFALSASGDWNANGTDGNPNTLWKNVEGTVASDGSVSVALNGQPGYYPNNGTSNYSFYGYCLNDAPESIETWGQLSYLSNEFSTTFTIDGSNDILWGSAVAPQLDGKEGDDNKYDGYNATYFRKGQNAENPNIKFGHMLTKLEFKAIRHSNYNTSSKLFIKSIKVVDVNTDLKLTIASQTPANTGKISTANGTKGEIIALNDESASLYPVHDYASLTDVGDEVMLFTTNDNNTSSFTVNVVLQDDNGATNGANGQDIIISAPADPGYFKIGKAYKVNITVQSLQKIVITATLTPWDESTPGIDTEL